MAPMLGAECNRRGDKLALRKVVTSSKPMALSTSLYLSQSQYSSDQYHESISLIQNRLLGVARR